MLINKSGGKKAQFKFYLDERICHLVLGGSQDRTMGALASVVQLRVMLGAFDVLCLSIKKLFEKRRPK